jgi:hypothetical protein
MCSNPVAFQDCSCLLSHVPSSTTVGINAWNWSQTGSILILSEVPEGTLLRSEHTGFAAGGPPSITVRDILASGWDHKLLQETLPAELARLAGSSEESRVQ